MPKDKFIAKLKAFISKKYLSQSRAALAWGLSPQFVSEVLKGSKNASQEILDDIGFNRVVSEDYKRVKK